MLQFGASPTDDTRSVNYDRNMFIIQATGFILSANIGLTKVFTNKFLVSFGPGSTKHFGSSFCRDELS